MTHGGGKSDCSEAETGGGEGVKTRTRFPLALVHPLLFVEVRGQARN